MESEKKEARKEVLLFFARFVVIGSICMLVTGQFGDWLQLLLVFAVFLAVAFGFFRVVKVLFNALI